MNQMNKEIAKPAARQILRDRSNGVIAQANGTITPYNLKDNWWETTFTDENGNDKYILNATDRIKAKEAAEKYKAEK